MSYKHDNNEELVLEREVEKARQMVIRSKEREYIIPKYHTAIQQSTQENKDAQKIGQWRNKGCPPEVSEILDRDMPGWRNTRYNTDPQAVAEGLVDRFKQGGNVYPKIYEKKNQTTPEKIQSTKDALKMSAWKMALKGKGSSVCPPEVCEYMDENIPGWRDERDLEAMAMDKLGGVVGRYNQRGNVLPKNYAKNKQTTPELIQEAKDAQKLNSLRYALKGKGECICSPLMREYLDREMPEWNPVVAEATEEQAIVVAAAATVASEDIFTQCFAFKNMTLDELHNTLVEKQLGASTDMFRIIICVCKNVV